MIRLIYTSQAVKPFSTDELMALLRECRQSNAQQGVTGVLLYYNECFIQVLEGNEEVINQIFSLIKKDKRHTNVTELERCYITQPQFEDWSMGFEELTDTQLKNLNIEGLNRFFNPSTENFNSEINQHLISSLMSFFSNSYKKRKQHQELPVHEEQYGILRWCHQGIRFAVSVLAFLMVIVIFLGVADVVYVIYEKLLSPPRFLLTIQDILATFGIFLAVLIAIEIFLNISLYLRTDVIPVKLVVATALMAISRKVIVFDFKEVEADYIYASAAVVLALGITYYLIDQDKK